MDDEPNYLALLPEHVFIKIASYINVEDLIAIEEADVVESWVIDDAFLNLSSFCMKISEINETTIALALNTLLRCGSHLRSFKFVNKDNFQLTDVVLKGKVDFIRELAARCPNLVTFDTNCYGDLNEDAINYVMFVNNCKFKKVEINYVSENLALNLIKSCKFLDTLNIYRFNHYNEQFIEQVADEIEKRTAYNGIMHLKLQSEREQHFNYLRHAIRIINACKQLTTLEFDCNLFNHVTYEDIINEFMHLQLNRTLKQVSLEVKEDTLLVLQFFDPHVVTELKVIGTIEDAETLNQLVRYDNIGSLGISIGIENLLALFIDESNFPKLREIKLDLYDCELNQEHNNLIQELLARRGQFFTELRLKTSNHRSIINAVINCCKNLDVLSVHLQPTEVENEKIDEQTFARLITLKVNCFVLLYCEENSEIYDNINALRSVINLKNDKLHIH